MRMKRSFAPVLVALVLVTACAQPPKRIERADDLPRFTYAVPAELEPVVRDPQRFAALAVPMRRDVEGMLAQYDIAERATQRRWLGVLVQLDLLEGRYEDAVRRSATIRELQEKPADKLLSGLTVRGLPPPCSAPAGATRPRTAPKWLASSMRNWSGCPTP
jgi:hypothetical protein